MPFGLELWIIMEGLQKAQRIVLHCNLVSLLFSQKVPFDEDSVLIPCQTALLKCFPTPTWAGSMIIQGGLLRIDHGLEGMRDP